MSITTDSPKFMQYLFLVFFLSIFVAIIVSSINRNKKNPNSPVTKNLKDTPLHETIRALILLMALPASAIAAIVFDNVTWALIFSGIFALLILSFLLTNSINKVEITINVYGTNAKIYYTITEFELRLQEGTLDLNGCNVKFPKGYKPPKRFYEQNDSDDPFSKYD